MGARHSGREAALQMLFQMEASGATADEAIDLFWRSFAADADPEGRAYADACVRGVGATRARRSTRTSRAASQHWRVERMARVDRNVLRLGHVGARATGPTCRARSSSTRPWSSRRPSAPTSRAPS